MIKMNSLRQTTLLIVSIAFAYTAMANPPANKMIKLNTESSKLEWVGEKVTGKHWGTVAIKSGNLILNDGKLVGGKIEINMQSIVVDDLTGNSKTKLEGHLKSDDFFSSEKNPTSTFEITQIREEKGKNGNTHSVSGNLNIKGIVKEVSFPARINVSEDKITAFASFSLDRTLWNVRYGSGSFFDNLGDKTIYDEFQIKFNITANL
jgi:polyisoprenoid-binding protein YceI